MEHRSRIVMQRGLIPQSLDEAVSVRNSSRVRTGTTAPTTVPAGTFAGDLYIDTINKAIYEAVVNNSEAEDAPPLIWRTSLVLDKSGTTISQAGNPEAGDGGPNDMYYKTDAPQSVWNKKLKQDGDPLNPDDYEWVKIADFGGSAEIIVGAPEPTSSQGNPGDYYYKESVPQTLWQKVLRESTDNGETDIPDPADPEDYVWAKFYTIVNGSASFTGAGDPDNAVGGPNDLYYRSDAPKSLWRKDYVEGNSEAPNDPTDPDSYEWAKFFDLTGAPTILSGDADPEGDAGVIGDLYYKTSRPQSIWEKKMVNTAGEQEEPVYALQWVKFFEIITGGFTISATKPADTTGQLEDICIVTTAPAYIYKKILKVSTDSSEEVWEPIAPLDSGKFIKGFAEPVVSTGNPLDLYYQSTFPYGIWQKVLRTATVPEDTVDPANPEDYVWIKIVDLPFPGGVYYGDAIPSNVTGEPNSTYYKTSVPQAIYVKELKEDGDPLTVGDYEWKSIFTVDLYDILSGEGVPGSSVGTANDVYFKTDLPQSIWRKKLKVAEGEEPDPDPNDPTSYEWVKFFDFIVGSVRRYEAQGDGSTTSFAIQHDMGTKNLIVQVYDNTTGQTVEVDVTRSDDNNILLETALPIESGNIMVALVSDSMASTIASVRQPVQLNINIPGGFAGSATDTVLENNKLAVRSTIPDWVLDRVQIKAIAPGGGPSVNIKAGSVSLMANPVVVTDEYQEITLNPTVPVPKNTDFEVTTTADSGASGLVIVLTGMASNYSI